MTYRNDWIQHPGPSCSKGCIALNHHPVDNLVCFVNIYLLDSVIHPLNSWSPSQFINTTGCSTRVGGEGRLSEQGVLLAYWGHGVYLILTKHIRISYSSLMTNNRYLNSRTFPVRILSVKTTIVSLFQISEFNITFR